MQYINKQKTLIIAFNNINHDLELLYHIDIYIGVYIFNIIILYNIIHIYNNILSKIQWIWLMKYDLS